MTIPKQVLATIADTRHQLTLAALEQRRATIRRDLDSTDGRLAAALLYGQHTVATDARRRLERLREQLAAVQGEMRQAVQARRVAIDAALQQLERPAVVRTAATSSRPTPARAPASPRGAGVASRRAMVPRSLGRVAEERFTTRPR